MPRTKRDASGVIEIITDEQFRQRQVLAGPLFELLFPQSWRASPVQNRYAASIERDTLAWLRKYGIGCTSAEAAKLVKFDCGRYGGYSLPYADYRSSLLITEYISLWLFWDDAQVERGLDWSIEDVIAALRGSSALSARPDRYLAAWADLGERLRRTQSQRWLGRLALAMREWLRNAKRETQMAEAFRRDPSCLEFDTCLGCRIISIGMFPTFFLLELAEGFELGDEFHDHETVIGLKTLASHLVGLGNELGGIAKDLKNRWLNLVLVYMHRHGTSVTQAFDRVVSIHNDTVLAFDELTAKLPSFAEPTDTLAKAWIQAVRHNVYGFALWESEAARYQEWKAIAGNTALVAEVANSPVPLRIDVSAVHTPVTKPVKPSFDPLQQE